jgi:hypothetical protein
VIGVYNIAIMQPPMFAAIASIRAATEAIGLPNLSAVRDLR